MHPEIDEVYKVLWQQTAWLHVQWLTFRTQYVGDAGNRNNELFNWAAPAFFGMIQVIQLDHVILGIARLFDRDRQTVSFYELQRRVERHAPHKLSDTFENALSAAAGKIQTLIDERDSKVAHLSFEQFSAGNLARQICITDIDKALKAMECLLNLLSIHYSGTPTGFQYTIPGPGDVESLVNLLRRCKQCEESRLAATLNRI
jgi:hypothetical protein